MTILAIETSCDETSAAVVRDGRILANAVSSQAELHAEYGGVVPELAAREHLKNLIPVVQSALDAAGIGRALLPAGPDPRPVHLSSGIGGTEVGQRVLTGIDAIAATQGPGLPTALLVGFKAGQAIAFALRKPFMGIHHHEAHLYSPWIRSIASSHEPGSAGVSPAWKELAGETPALPATASENSFSSVAGLKGESEFIADFSGFQPNVSLIVSGGHTMLVLVESELKHRVLGSTVDDAAGECFDKTGKLMGLTYPAGPEMDRLSESGNPKAFDFPRPLLNDASDDFSFSGLKTSVRYFLRDNPALLQDAKKIRDLCASIQAAIVEVLVAKTIRAAQRQGVRCITASGGVICNRALRRELAHACDKNNFALRLAEPSLCTDNAAMIGILAERKLLAGLPSSDLDAEIQPGWVLA